MKQLIIVFYMIFVVNMSSAYYRHADGSATTNGYKYTFTKLPSGGVKLVGYKKDSYYYYSNYKQAISPEPIGELIIPDTLAGFFVESIAPNAFYNCDLMTSVSIPSSVIELAEVEGDMMGAIYAPFAGCTNLTSITIPQVVCNDGLSKWFSNVSSIKHIELSGLITNIPQHAFSEYINVSTVTLPSTITKLRVGTFAFSDSTVVNIFKEGFVCNGWTNISGQVISDPFHSAKEVVVFPKWNKIMVIKFDGNGGIGVMPEQAVAEGNVLTPNEFLRNGYLFMGWSISADGCVIYADSATITGVSWDVSNVDFYAIWKPSAPRIIPSDNMAYLNVSQMVSLSSDAEDVTILYTTDGSDPAMSG